MPEDKALYCIECEQDFVWTVSEQLHMASRYTTLFEPQRCKKCRIRRAKERSKVS